MAKKPIDDDDDDLSDFDFTEDSDEEFEGFDEDDDDFFDDEDDDELSENDNEISTENDAVQKKESSVEAEENLEEGSKEDLTEENEEAATSAPPIAETGPIAPDQIPVTLTVEIGQIEIPVHQLLKLEPGNMLELHTHPAHVVNLTINSKVVGKGELIRIGDILGVRLLQLGAGQE